MLFIGDMSRNRKPGDLLNNKIALEATEPDSYVFSENNNSPPRHNIYNYIIREPEI